MSSGGAGRSHPARAIGRRTLLGGIGAGAVWLLVSPLLPLDRIAGLARFRIYNVAGRVPRFDRVTVRGVSGRERVFGLRALGELPLSEVTADFHCVTGWTVPDVTWAGTRLRDLIGAALGDESALWVHFYSADGVYADSLPWEVAVRDDVAVVWRMEGQPLASHHGGPVRLVVGPMYGFKSVKWLARVELSGRELIGYWEERGYAADAFVRRPPLPRLEQAAVRRYPEAGVVFSIPLTWSVTDGVARAITVASASPKPGAVASVTIYDYRFPSEVDGPMVVEFATAAGFFGASMSAQTRLQIDGNEALSFESRDTGGVLARNVFVARHHQVILIEQKAPTTEFAQLKPIFDGILASLRLERPRFRP